MTLVVVTTLHLKKQCKFLYVPLLGGKRPLCSSFFTEIMYFYPLDIKIRRLFVMDDQCCGALFGMDLIRLR